MEPTMTKTKTKTRIYQADLVVMRTDGKSGLYCMTYDISPDNEVDWENDGTLVLIQEMGDEDEVIVYDYTD